METVPADFSFTSKINASPQFGPDVVLISPRYVGGVREYELRVKRSVRNNQTDHQLSVFDQINEHADGAVDSCGET